jgi:hypothetical protein
MSNACEERGIPEYLWRKDRHDIEIEDTDSLYRRVPSGFFAEKENTKKVTSTAFPLKNDSYNVVSLCQEHKDVLYSIRDGIDHYFDHGVIEIDISKLSNKEFEYTGGKEKYKCELKFNHIPETCMYPHAEIHVYINGEKKDQVNAKEAKAALRLFLQEAHEIVLFPPTY